MLKLIKMVCKYNKKAEKPITPDDVRMAVMMNRHLLIKRYERRIKEKEEMRV